MKHTGRNLQITTLIHNGPKDNLNGEGDGQAQILEKLPKIGIGIGPHRTSFSCSLNTWQKGKKLTSFFCCATSPLRRLYLADPEGRGTVQLLFFTALQSLLPIALAHSKPKRTLKNCRAGA